MSWKTKWLWMWEVLDKGLCARAQRRHYEHNMALLLARQGQWPFSFGWPEWK
jgi:hypothetical protein